MQRRRAIAGIIVLLACASAPAQVAFKEIPAPNIWIGNMSADGRVGVGISLAAGQGKTVDGYRWTADGGVENIGGFQGYGIIVSRDGKTIVGHILNSDGYSEAAIWLGGKNWRLLGRVPGQSPDKESKVMSIVAGVSGDGSVVVGYVKFETLTHACRWDAQNGAAVDLGSFWGQSSQVQGVSADGRVMVGWNYNPKGTFPYDGRQGVIFWDGTERLMHPFGLAGEAVAANNAGSIIVGRFDPTNSYTGYRKPTTYRYTEWDGKFEDLGAASSESTLIDINQYTSRPLGLSDDGEVVGGDTGFLTGKVASLWTRQTGMVRVGQWLTAQGVTAHEGWVLLQTTYVSPDGKFIQGLGYKPQIGNDVYGSWIVTLP